MKKFYKRQSKTYGNWGKIQIGGIILAKHKKVELFVQNTNRRNYLGETQTCGIIWAKQNRRNYLGETQTGGII
jgi:hypothetical protein